MRKIIITFFASLLMFSVAVVAQNVNPIQNADFEDWTTESFLFQQVEVPEGWKGLTIDIDTMGLQFTYPISIISKTTDAQNGNYAALLETKTFDTLVMMAMNAMGIADINMMPTIMSIGGINILSVATDMFGILSNPDYETALMQMMLTADLSDYFMGGAALNGLKPSALEGYYKYISGQGADDEAMIMMIGSVYDNNSQRRMIAGVGAMVLSEVDEYTNFQVPYYPLLPLPADTIEVVMFSSQLYSMQLGSKLYIDNLSLVGQNGIVMPLMSSEVSCYPNPTNGVVVLSLSSDVPAEVSFFNVLGQKVLSQKMCVDGACFLLPESGVYMMEVLQGGVRTTKSVVVK